MKDIPSKIKETFEALQERYEFYIVLKRLNGKFYVYHQTSRFDKANKKIKTVSQYLGRILEDGKFIKRALVSINDDKEDKRITRQFEVVQKFKTLDEKEDIILKTLSMNGRASLVTLAKRINLNSQALYKKIHLLEDKYGIKYIAEIDIEKLGYQKYFALIKFESDKPDYKEIIKALEDDPKVQLVALTNGLYDLVIYFCAESNRAVTFFIHGTRVSTVFKKYRAKWFVAPYFDDYGYVPLRNKFFELLKDKVWNRTKENPRPKLNNITNREFTILKELNSDGKKDFTEIDKDYSFDSGGSQYTYHKLKENGLLKRITITMDRLQIKYNVIFLSSIIDAEKFDNTRSVLLKEIIQYSKGPITKYALVGDIEVPHGIIFIFPVFTENELQETNLFINKNIKGLNLETLIITNILIGTFCYRRFDSTYSNQHRLLIKEYKMVMPTENINYDI